MNAADFVSTGDNRDDYDDAWAPRLGFSYDVNADEQFVVHGGAGRFYDRNLFSIMSLEVSKAALSPVADPFPGSRRRANAIAAPTLAGPASPGTRPTSSRASTRSRRSRSPPAAPNCSC